MARLTSRWGKMRRKVASFTRRFGAGAVEGYLHKKWWLEPCRNSASYSTRWAVSYCPRARLALPKPASFEPDCMSAKPPLTLVYGAFAALAVAWASGVEISLLRPRLNSHYIACRLCYSFCERRSPLWMASPFTVKWRHFQSLGHID